MDKYEYKVKLEQIEKMAAKKDFITAAKIADGIDWRKEKSVTTLLKIADIYEETDRLEECSELLNMVYDRSPMGRRVVYRMAEIAVKMQDFEEAIQLYKEFVKIAPHDLNRYILKYQIQRGRGAAITDQIAALEEFKNHEYDERWAYELACLYEEAGNIEECIEACDELILWFSEGEYVVKAMELKLKYQELTATQQEKYEHRYEYLEKVAEEALPEVEETEVQEEATKEETPAEEAIVPEETEASAAEEETPQVKEINVNKFSTINLQAELAMNLQELLSQVEEDTKAALDTEEEKGDTQEFVPFKTVVIEEAVEETEIVNEEVAEDVEEVIPEEAETEVEEELEAEAETAVEEEFEAEAETEVGEELEAEFEPEAEETVHGTVEEKLSETAELQTEILKYIAVPQKTSMEELYRTEEDGQMTLAIGTEDALEKQITGQMTIGEVLEAWEEKKRQMREQMEAAEAKKPAVLFETGEISSLLEDFIPKTPKDIEPEAAEIAEPEEETVTVEPEEELAEEVTEEIAEEMTEEACFEDDLPQDIDFGEALEAFWEEPKTEEQPEQEEMPAEIPEEKSSIGENTASMIDAIERALALEMDALQTKGDSLTEEQEQIFAYFTSVNGMKNQLISILSEESNYAGKEDSREGNLIITGHPGNGKTTLAIDIVKVLQKQRKVKGAKLAKVSGDGMNKKNPEEIIAKLGGGALIIERAGSLKDETIELLSGAMDGYTGGLLVILEDDGNEIEHMMAKHKEFASKFNRFVDIPIFSNDELVAFGKSYAAEKEYFFDDMAVLALYDSIGVRQTMEHVVNIAEVKEFIDDAIMHAEKKSKGFFAKFSKKRIDEYGNKLLLEEDFNC